MNKTEKETADSEYYFSTQKDVIEFLKAAEVELQEEDEGKFKDIDEKIKSIVKCKLIDFAFNQQYMFAVEKIKACKGGWIGKVWRSRG